MKTLTFLLSIIIEVYTMLLLLRIWIQWVHCDFYNSFSQFIIKTTQPITKSLRQIVPEFGPIDSASAILVFALSIIKAIVLLMSETSQSIIWISAMLILAKTIGLLIFWVLLVILIMNWTKQSFNPIKHVLAQLIEPFLVFIRKLLPAIGNIDLSPIILALLLYIVNMGIAELLQLSGSMILLKLWMSL